MKKNKPSTFFNDDKKCEECNSILKRKDREPLFHFRKRRFCNRKCSYKNRTEKLSDSMTCNICKKILNISEFSPRRDRPRGVYYTCKKCINKKSALREFSPQTECVKTCSKCSMDLPIKMFFIEKRMKDGRSSNCKKCENIRKLKILRNNPQVKMRENLRKRVRGALHGVNKSSDTMSLIGCSIEELKLHLESKFVSGMSWDNYGKWHIDHIRPCSSFDLTLEENQLECFNYKNLQPLWAMDNIKKGSKI